eukprot:2268646-Pyramimonas_sp.AAC.1
MSSFPLAESSSLRGGAPPFRPTFSGDVGGGRDASGGPSSLNTAPIGPPIGRSGGDARSVADCRRLWKQRRILRKPGTLR